MRTAVKRRPGQRGTKAWLHQYGDPLFCVRYRYDRVQRKRFTTVELIVATADWVPPALATTLVGVHVAWGEAALAGRIKQAGGQWNPERRLWELAYGQVRSLDLLEHLVWLDG
jgi:hypothetical protein